MTRARSLLDIAQIWRWRRVRRHGVVLAAIVGPSSLGVAYTWRGARVGVGDREYLAHCLTGVERRRQLAVAADIRRTYPCWLGRD